MNIFDICKEEPYSYKKRRNNTGSTWFSRLFESEHVYEIYYYNTFLRRTTHDEEDAKEIVRLMNCAWQVGAADFASRVHIMKNDITIA